MYVFWLIISTLGSKKIVKCLLLSTNGTKLSTRILIRKNKNYT